MNRAGLAPGGGLWRGGARPIPSPGGELGTRTRSLYPYPSSYPLEFPTALTPIVARARAPLHLDRRPRLSDHRRSARPAAPRSSRTSRLRCDRVPRGRHAMTVAQMTAFGLRADQPGPLRRRPHRSTSATRALDKVAAAWAYQQWKNGSMSHNPTTRSRSPRDGRAPARTWPSGYTYTQVVAAWIASPSHYANLVHDYTIGRHRLLRGQRQALLVAGVRQVPRHQGAGPSCRPTSRAPSSAYPAEPAAPAGTRSR